MLQWSSIAIISERAFVILVPYIQFIGIPLSHMWLNIGYELLSNVSSYNGNTGYTTGTYQYCKVALAT